MVAFFRELLIVVVIAVGISVGLRSTVQDFVIQQSSMEPTLYEGQQVLVNKFIYKFREPERGDVIILQPPPPYGPREIPFIKRVIALPGETIEVKNTAVYVNGSKLSEPYIKEPPGYTLPPQKIPAGEYFVLGDNRNNANDSHMGWLVPRQNIIGKAWLLVWPPGEWGVVANYSLQKQPLGAATN